MPVSVPLLAVPKHELTITLDGNLFDLAVRLVGSIIAVSVSMNGDDVIDGIRAVSGTLLMPYQYLEAGNFMFLTAGGSLPDYKRFGVDQFLVYFTAAELSAMRVPSNLPLPASFFDPSGALPQRYT